MSKGIMSRSAAIKAAEFHRSKATSPTLKAYWQGIINSLKKRAA